MTTFPSTIPSVTRCLRVMLHVQPVSNLTTNFQQASNKSSFFLRSRPFPSPLFLPVFEPFLSECASVLRIIMCFRFQVQLQLLDLFSRTLHYNSEFLAFITRGRRQCQCLSVDTPAYQEVKGYSQKQGF